MAMNKFTYDPERLHYSEVKKDLHSKFIRVFVYITAGLTLAIFLNVLYAVFFDTPYERQLRQENRSLEQDFELLYQRYSQIDTVLKSIKSTDENIYRMIFESEPVRRSGVRNTEYGGINYLDLMDRENKSIVRETADILDDVNNSIQQNADEYSHLMSLAGGKFEMLSSIPAVQPVSNPDMIRLASGYGYRVHPIYKILKFHSGMDFTASVGTPVFATGDGIVEEVMFTRRGSGNTIVINHGSGYKTSYSHLDGFNVKKGQKVKRKNVIGWVGNTGLSVAPHLHYEVLLHDKPVNPVNYFFLELTPAQYDKMIELSIKSGQSFD